MNLAYSASFVGYLRRISCLRNVTVVCSTPSNNILAFKYSFSLA